MLDIYIMKYELILNYLQVKSLTRSITSASELFSFSILMATVIGIWPPWIPSAVAETTRPKAPSPRTSPSSSRFRSNSHSGSSSNVYSPLPMNSSLWNRKHFKIYIFPNSKLTQIRVIQDSDQTEFLFFMLNLEKKNRNFLLEITQVVKKYTNLCDYEIICCHISCNEWFLSFWNISNVEIFHFK